MEIRKIDNIDIHPSATVRVKEMGHITELMYSDSYSSKCNILKLDNDHYIDLTTGETKDFVHIENRSQDLKSVKQSLGRLRDYLNTNVTDVSRCRWVTLTYADNMTDSKRLYEDFKKFNMRMRYHVGNYDYIVAMEPQGRGAWHCHVVMIFNDKAPYISNDLMAKIWGHGFVTVKKLDDVDNVGAYLTAYLGDMSWEDAEKLDHAEQMKLNGLHVKEIECDDSGQVKTKRFIKGARLHMYPPKFNIYRCSKGIKKPIVLYAPEEIAQKKVSAATLTFEKTILLSDQENDFEKTISYRYYNKIRNK